MNFIAGKPVTIEQMYETVKAKFPQYTITLKRNRLLGFHYIEIRKSALIGSWIRLSKDKVSLVGAIPSFIVRAFFGGLILIAFISGKLKRLKQEVGGYLQAQYA